MDWGGPTFVVLLVVISTVGWLVNNWIRARHGYPLEDELFGKSERADTEEAKKLREQNQQLRDIVERMEDRMIVLERIVTDKGYTVAEEIEALRDRPRSLDNDTGVRLDLGRKEQV